jgi:phosphatidylinositol alpha-1,6-mannosyltransferase
LTPDFPPAHGGIQLFAERLAEGVKGFDTRVLTLAGPGARSYDDASPLAVRRVSAGGSWAPAARNARLNAAALRSALSFRPHVTLCMHLVTSPASAAIRAALGARTVQYFHAQEIAGKPKLAAFAANSADVVIAVSSYTAALVSATGAKPAVLRLISPGVDLPARRPPAPVERPTFVTVARLRDRYKGHDVLVRSLALVRERVADVQWVVIGDGPLRAELEALARARRVEDSVRFLGAVSDEERDRWLARAALLAMPSRLPGPGLAGEGFGIAYLEAGAHGRPVVAGNVGGALDAVQDGVTGLLVDPTDPRAVAEAIVKLLVDEQLARALGEAGAQRARELAWPLIAERVEAVLREALGSQAAAV